MTTTQSPDYIKALLTPTTKGQTSRKAWSVDVENVWVPFFTATNVMGETAIAPDVLGAPVRLAKNPDGEVKFSTNGRPMMRVHPDLNAQIGIVRENFVAGLSAYAGTVQEERPDEFAAYIAEINLAGTPVLEQDGADLAVATSQREVALKAAEEAAKPKTTRATTKAVQGNTPAPAERVPATASAS